MAERVNGDRTPRMVMRGIRKRFGATVALDGVDFSVRAGEVHALVGENGAGKSTLMKIFSGALAPDAGIMELEGHLYRPRNAHDARMAGVAMIYQELSLAPHLSVEENILLGMEPTRMGIVRSAEVRSRTHRALEELGHGSIDPRRRVGTLSIAERQIVEIARALAVGCRVLVLDEPTSTLSQRDIDRLFEVIRRLQRQMHAVVYISHFIEEVKRIAGSVTVLRDGKTVGGGRTSDFTVAEIVGMMIGRRVDQGYPRSERTPGEVVLDVRGLASVPKPAAASFSLHRGEVLGIAGLVGAGRTELLRAIFGLAPVTAGTVRIGLVSGAGSPADRWMQGAGLLSEDRGAEGLAVRLSITENIMMNLRKDSNLLGILRPSRLDSNARTWIERLGIRSLGPRQPVRSLSGGNQQKVAIARLLHEDVDVLLLDEPTRGIDVASKFQVYELIDQLSRGDAPRGKKAKGVLIVSSYLPELLGVSDRIAVMHRGRLGEPRPTEEWTEHSLMLEATGQGA